MLKLFAIVESVLGTLELVPVRLTVWNLPVDLDCRRGLRWLQTTLTLGFIGPQEQDNKCHYLPVTSCSLD